MSAIILQEDTTDSGKDEESNPTAAISDEPGNASRNVASSKADDSFTQNLDQPLSIIDTIEAIPKTVSPEKMSVHKSKDVILGHMQKGAGDSKLTESSSIPLPIDSKKVHNDNIESEFNAEDLLDSEKSIANSDSQEFSKHLDVLKSVVEMGYKETVIDDASDTEFELRWSDDEAEDENNATPLSEEALKILDIELGIADAQRFENSKENTGTMITPSSGPSSTQNLFTSEKLKEFVGDGNIEKVCFKESLELEEKGNSQMTIATDVVVEKYSEQTSLPVKELGLVESSSRSGTDSKDETTLTPESAIDVVKLEKANSEDISTVKSELSLTKYIVSDKTKSNLSLKNVNLTDLENKMHVDEEDKISEICIDENYGQTSLHVKELLLIEGSSKSDSEAKDESNLESANAKDVIESEKATSRNISKGEREVSMPKDIVTEKNAPDLISKNEKLTDIENVMNEVNKISEIDIDETIVDLKHLIDQDEDTIKQLGLDAGKPDTRNYTKDEPEKISKAIQERAELTEGESNTAEANSESVQINLAMTDGNVTDEKVQPMDEDIYPKLDSLVDVADTSVGTDLRENSSISKLDYLKATCLSKHKDDNKNKNDQKAGNVNNSEIASDMLTNKVDLGITSEEFYTVKSSCMENVQQSFTDQVDNHVDDNKVKSLEGNLVTESDKDNIEEALSVQNIAKDNDFVKNDSIEKDCKNVDDKMEKTSSEANLDLSVRDSRPVLEEFITPDITNDSIKINTEHRLTRPDVMLDIPTQEFEFDDFEDSSETPGQSDEINKDKSDLTTKTVTEIVSQLTKEIDNEHTDIVEKHDINKTESISGNKIKEINDVEFSKDEPSDTIKDSELSLIGDTKNKLVGNDKIPNNTAKSELSKDEDIILGSNSEQNIEKANINFQPSTAKDNTTYTHKEAISTEDEDLATKLKSTDKVQKTNQSTSEIIEPAERTQISDMNTELSTSENFESKEKEIAPKSKEIDLQASTSDIDKNADIDSKPTEKSNNPEDIVPHASTSENLESKSIEKIQKSDIETLPSTSEVTEETQEVTDSLGLLAESSRVMDDDDDEEQEEDDADDGDGDDGEGDDFDPDDEENSNPTGEHSEESNPPHSEVDIQEDGIDIDDADTLLGDTTDITVEENDTTVGPTDSTNAETVEKSTELQVVAVADPPSSKAKSPDAVKVAKPKERRASILAGLLSQPAADMNIVKLDDVSKTLEVLTKSDISKISDIGVVDLGGSSSDDDVQEKNNKNEVPSIIRKAQLLAENISAKPQVESVKKDDNEKNKTGEVFSLDSDDDDKSGANDVSYIGTPRENNKCINYSCTSDESVPYYLADRMTIAYYGAARRRKRAVCKNCLEVVSSRNEGLVAGIKDLRPLMSLRMSRATQTLLEISDSDSEGEDEPVGEEGARFLEDQLTDMINDMWSKYKLDDRLKATEDYLEAELEKMQKQSEEVDKLLRDCQKATDELRTEFYSSFEGPRHELPGISIHDTPIASYSCFETEEVVEEISKFPVRYPKRRSTTAVETPAKKQAMTFEDRKITRSMKMGGQGKLDEDKDISVVRLSAEAAPADLPPPGEIVKPPIKVGVQVYAMKNQYGAWLKGRVLEIQSKTNDAQYTVCRVRFDHKTNYKTLSARSIAYTEPCEVRMDIGTRVIALFKNSENSNKRGEFYYSGVIAEVPNPVNSYRYLVFFDDGYAQYVEHKHTRLVYESKKLVWEEVHPFSRDFVCNYLMKYPERPMVRLHPGHTISVEWNGKWWDTRVIEVDAALVHIEFPDKRTEWIYRGSTRLKPLFAELLAAKRGDRARLPRSTKANTKANVPYVEYTRSDDQVKADTQAEDLRRQRSVAKKSTTIAQQISNAATDGVISRVVFYTPKNSVRPLKMVPHSCGPHCKRTDLISLQDLRTYNPLTKPLLSGWERQIIRHKASRSVMYRAPCGRRLRRMSELHQYLRAIRSEMPVDLFDFNPNTHCLAEFVLNKTNVQKKDLSHGKENVPVPCVNYYDHSLPEFCSYNTVRTPTAGVPLNLDPDFLCGCDCEDDCMNKSKCACWKMTLEGARTIGMDGSDIGYNYRRLPEPLPSGIYECNSRCKCKSTCLNRVVQNPLQLKLQVFKTLNRGWGIRALNDVPKGSFICIYAGNLLTDATANLDGLNEGDEYLAELDYIEVVESMKEGYEDDIPDIDKVLDRKESNKSGSESDTESTQSEDEDSQKKTKTDGDFQPGHLGFGLTEFSKRLRRRDKKKDKGDENKEESGEKSEKKEDGEECITISDDEEVRVSQREPSRFAAQESMTDNKVVSKYRSIRSYFGKDEACYIMDAKVQGNIGRYLNHSCSPNVFVQNVFVDTHDPRFPWVSFFALHHIRAGTELTWNYNYDVGSVPGKVLYCYCGAPNCRGRLL